MQEMHLKTSDNPCIKRAWMNHLFHSKFADKFREAAIIHERVLFKPMNIILDSDSHYVIVSGMLQNTPVVLVSVYAPTWNDNQFMRLFVKIPNADSHCIIICGDFNLVQDVILNRSSPAQTTLSKSANVVNYASQLGISDPWSFKKPHGRAFSYIHATHSLVSTFYLITS